MSAIQAGKFGDDAKTWDVYTEWKAIQDTFLKGSGFKIDYEVMPSWTKDLSETVE